VDFGELGAGVGQEFLRVLLALCQLFAALEASMRRSFDCFDERVQQL